ncbi:MAG TPA: glycine oxidase ThiO [Cyanobacteria bacterium UBA11149]|nr:glycine oxidase ThiO [Cyanobacteria bacterium UBA11367]HBE57638.1 glycine oxidase ThiO [Cyanobacteria bacterium UBA11366]HBK64012.1 glycine oxidase ThiO [Cyanobacteria bacterium UBA11166]HBR75103.1 glycine oxidase ThiO [Cyanobacteria bacterium UBA11159]HBS69174.1 glycine oxidase ThiO [Cyanobacteria bacterium UBA11153]HBW90929.1 glycine oxidase ThiO [Cyanobacteria bacterium UBA11149]HCA93561.1 glycine oxidase ThiO [Cyanobacteria bacterium UBA9226]
MNGSSDILIIGGGVIGLAIALELKLRGGAVTVLTRNLKEASTLAAAGMLAPGAEQIPPSPMLDLCLRSRSLYPEWIGKLEQLTGISCGYWPSGILAPVYEDLRGSGENSTNTIPHPLWLDKETINFYQPGLGTDVLGGWWYPEDGQVDNRELIEALQQAVKDLGVNLKEGVIVEAIEQQNRVIRSVRTSVGSFQANHYILATGAWANELLPLPIYPKKGQMVSVKVPNSHHQPLPLQKVLFGPETYLVPRRDGRLIIGATSEDVGWQPHNTPAGIQTLLARAMRLYPQLQDWAIQEYWWGFRPATPDELPILGTSPCQNLTLATGHYRNGILLAPITGLLIADLIAAKKSDSLLEHFNYERFYNKSSPAQTNLMITSIINPISPPSSALTEETKADQLIIAGRKFNSRLMTGTGKYNSIPEMQQSIAASGSQIVTVAVRRVQTKAPGHEGLAEALDWTKIWMLPNTAGCQTAEEAIRVARLGREMAKLLGQEENNFVKLEVIPDSKYLLPDPIGTLQAAEQLVKEGFAVLPYINADPLLAKRLEEVGCATVMPLGSPIGSGQGIKNAANIQIIIEEAKVPVVVDAGIGTPSEAAYAMELGADALLINSAIALAKNPVAMGRAMGMATEAGRLAYLAGRMPVKSYASASSPLTGTIS